MKYYKLIDLPNFGLIVRTNGPIQHEYSADKGWVRTGILTRYFNDESDYYNLYVELTEEEAYDEIGLEND